MADATSLVLYDPRTADPEVIALAGFLAGYAGRTREAYALDLRQFLAWWHTRQLRLFDVHRSDIELYARELEERGKARATIGRRLSTITGFYRYATEEGLIEHSPAVHVRRPRLDYESHAVGLDRNELGAFLAAAGLSSPTTTPWPRCWPSTACASPRPSAPTSTTSTSSGDTAR